MNREQTLNAVDVMLAWANGATVQYKKIVGDTDGWVHCDYPGWNWDKWHYRVKPKPKVVERWALSDEQGHHTTMLDLDSARAVADHWEMMGSTGICLTHLKGEEQPWQK